MGLGQRLLDDAPRPALSVEPGMEQHRGTRGSELFETRRAGANAEATPLFPAASTMERTPQAARWLVPQIDRMNAEELLGIVRSIDDALNNTSLILLFEVGGKRFLFPGDAQLENWNYALKDSPEADDNQKLLSGTDFYKVGHHGSLNATPKTLWNLFKKRSEDGNKPGRLSTAVSTMAGKHGSQSSKTEVPRKTLVEALESESNFSTTQQLRKASDMSNLTEFKIP